MINIIFVLQIETVSFETIISKHCHQFFFHCYLSVYFYYIVRFTNLKDNRIKELTLKYFNFVVRLMLGDHQQDSCVPTGADFLSQLMDAAKMHACMCIN